ncbi:hypothetical protein EG831_06560, partial [bacterium]|nr:hypothetical protein [bacterium]
MGTNGGILFNTTTGDLLAGNANLPAPAPSLRILPYWDDIDSDSGNVYWEVLGSAPNRRLVVEWHNRPHYSNTGSGTFELVLFEGSNEMLFQYADLDYGNIAHNYGASATIGIQGSSVAADSLYLLFAYNDTGSLHDNMAIRLYLPQVIWTSPADGATGAHVVAPIKAAFSVPMDTASVAVSWDPAPVTFARSWNATLDTLTLVHPNLGYSSTYTIGITGNDQYGYPLRPGPVSNPFTFATWDAPEVIHDQLATTGNANVCQVFGDFSTYSTYLADDIDLAGMDSVVVSAIEIYGDYWTGHSGHPLDSLYVGFTTDSTDLPAWSQAVFQRNVPAGSFDDVPLTGTQNTYIMYLDPPAVLHNGKNWMVFAPIMNFSAKDGQWGWCQNNPPAVNHGSGPAARNPGGGFGSSTDWQRASTWPGMAGDAVFRALGRTYPTPHAFGTIDTTITFTTPAGNTLAGITFCPADSNFYFVSMNDDSVYRLDPETWAMAAAFATDNPGGGTPWGLSWDGTHFWVSHIEGSICLNKQYTFAGAYTGENYDVTGVGGSGWMGGMDFDGTYTWQTAVGGSNKLYRLDLANDTVVDSIPGIPWGTSQRGCSYIPWTDQFLSGGWNTGLIYLLDDQGNQLLTASLGSVADLDIYDFIAEGHELWALVALNTSPNTIHKVWLGITRPLGVEGRPAAVAGPRAVLGLMPNYPNPVRGRTTISFSLPKAGDYAFRVYNIAGQLV